MDNIIVSNGMHELDKKNYELRVDKVMLMQENHSLKQELSKLKLEIGALRKANRNYQKRHMKAYSDYFKGKTADENFAPMRIVLYAVLPVAGLFLGSTLTLLICLGRV